MSAAPAQRDARTLWTAGVIADLHLGITPERIAADLGVAPGAVAKRLRRTGDPACRQAAAVFERVDKARQRRADGPGRRGGRPLTDADRAAGVAAQRARRAAWVADIEQRLADGQTPVQVVADLETTATAAYYRLRAAGRPDLARALTGAMYAERVARSGGGARSDVRAWIAAGLAEDTDTTTTGDPT